MNSINILHIESFSMLPHDEHNFGYRVMIPRSEFRLKCVLEIRHPEHGKQGQFILTLAAYEYMEQDGLKECLQKLLNKDFSSVDMQINSTRFEHCTVDRSRIHAVEYSHFEEPYKSIFDQVFTAANWKIQHSITPSST